MDTLPACMFHNWGEEPPRVGLFLASTPSMHKHGTYNLEGISPYRLRCVLIRFIFIFPKEEPLEITCQPSPALSQFFLFKHLAVFLPWFPSIRLGLSLCRGPDGPRPHNQDRCTLGQSYSKSEISEGECCSVKPQIIDSAINLNNELVEI